MKKKLFKLASALATIASIGFVVFVIQKISNGHAFERYRTVWLYETDYFSVGLVLLVFICSPVVYYFIYKINKTKTNTEEERIKNELLKRRQNKETENKKYNKNEERNTNPQAD